MTLSCPRYLSSVSRLLWRVFSVAFFGFSFLPMTAIPSPPPESAPGGPLYSGVCALARIIFPTGGPKHGEQVGRADSTGGDWDRSQACRMTPAVRSGRLAAGRVCALVSATTQVLCGTP